MPVHASAPDCPNVGPYRYLWIDALTQRVREGGRVVNVSAVIDSASGRSGRPLRRDVRDVEVDRAVP